MSNYNKQYQVSRSVNLAFIDRPPRLQNITYENLFVNHKDRNKINNNIDNFEWCTAQENTQYSLNMILKVIK